MIDASSICLQSRYPVIRRAQHDALASALSDNLLPSVLDEDLSLVLGPNPPLNQPWQPMSLLPDGLQSDPTSSAIWNAASKLNRLKGLLIEGSMDPSLLWPRSFGVRSTALPEPRPFWQGTTTMVIKFNLATPSGNWYFRTPDGIDIERPPFLPPNQPQLIDTEPAGAVEAELPPGMGPMTPALLRTLTWALTS